MKIEVKIETTYQEYNNFKIGELVYSDYPKGIYKIIEIKKTFKNLTQDKKIEGHPIFVCEKRFTKNGGKTQKIKREFHYISFNKLESRIKSLEDEKSRLNQNINDLNKILNENKL